MEYADVQLLWNGHLDIYKFTGFEKNYLKHFNHVITMDPFKVKSTFLLWKTRISSLNMTEGSEIPNPYLMSYT